MDYEINIILLSQLKQAEEYFKLSGGLLTDIIIIGARNPSNKIYTTIIVVDEKIAEHLEVTQNWTRGIPFHDCARFITYDNWEKVLGLLRPFQNLK